MSKTFKVVYECPSGNTLTAEWEPDRGEISLKVMPGSHDLELGKQPLDIDVAPEHINHLIVQLRLMQKSVSS